MAFIYFFDWNLRCLPDFYCLLRQRESYVSRSVFLEQRVNFVSTNYSDEILFSQSVLFHRLYREFSWWYFLFFTSHSPALTFPLSLYINPNSKLFMMGSSLFSPLRKRMFMLLLICSYENDYSTHHMDFLYSGVCVFEWSIYRTLRQHDHR